jgi:hypothetical protein
MLTDEFANLSFFQKHVIIFGNYWYRLSTYIVGFCFMDTGPLASGLAFSGYDEKTGKPMFNKARNVGIRGLLFTDKVKNWLACWNTSVHEWLKNYVFMRCLPSDPAKRGQGTVKASFIAFFVSAIWHGFYPGFFAFFFGAFLMDTH